MNQTNGREPSPPGPAQSSASTPGASAPGEPATAARMMAKEAAWLGVDNVVTIVVTLGMSIAAARLLGPTLMGRFNYAVWGTEMLSLLTDLGIPWAVRRYVSEANERGDLAQMSAIASACRRVQAGAAGVVVGLSLLGIGVWCPPEQRVFSALLALSVGASAVLSVPAAVLWAIGRLGVSVRASLAGTLLRTVLTTLSLTLGWGLEGLAAATLGGRALDCVLRLVALRQVTRHWPEPVSLDVRLRRRLLGTCRAQAGLLFIESVLWRRSEMFALERLQVPAEGAFYSVTFGLVQQVQLVPQLLAASAGARMMRREGGTEALGTLASRSVWMVAVVAAPMLLGAAALAPAAVEVLWGRAYAPAAPVLALLALGGLLRSLALPIIDALYLAERELSVVRLSLGLVVVNLGLGSWWVHMSGAVGAAAAKVSVHAIALWLFAFVASRDVGLRLSTGALLRLLCACGGMALAAAGAAFWLEPPLALLAGVPAGAIVFLWGLRLGRVLGAEDTRGLHAIAELVPKRGRPLFGRAISYATGHAAPQGAAPNEGMTKALPSSPTGA